MVGDGSVERGEGAVVDNWAMTDVDVVVGSGDSVVVGACVGEVVV